jgi:effector-binding domain-containing protein
MAEAEGLTLLGPFRIVLKNMGPTAEGTMPFQLQLPIIDQPTDEDLQADYGFEIVVLDAVEVAYTFHKGSMDQLQAPFMALMNWVPENGKQIAGLPCMIVYSVPENEEPSIVELQVPVQ